MISQSIKPHLKVLYMPFPYFWVYFSSFWCFWTTFRNFLRSETSWLSSKPRRAIKFAYCPWAIRDNPAPSAANQIAPFAKTNACHIINTIITHFQHCQYNIFRTAKIANGITKLILYVSTALTHKPFFINSLCPHIYEKFEPSHRGIELPTIIFIFNNLISCVGTDASKTHYFHTLLKSPARPGRGGEGGGEEDGRGSLSPLLLVETREKVPFQLFKYYMINHMPV